MSDTELRQILNPRYQLLEEPACLRLLQSVFGRYIVEELPIRAVFHDHVESLLRLDYLI